MADFVWQQGAKCHRVVCPQHVKEELTPSHPRSQVDGRHAHGNRLAKLDRADIHLRLEIDTKSARSSSEISHDHACHPAREWRRELKVKSRGSFILDEYRIGEVVELDK